MWQTMPPLLRRGDYVSSLQGRREPADVLSWRAGTRTIRRRNGRAGGAPAGAVAAPLPRPCPDLHRPRARLAQASAALPPGPNDLATYWASLGVFVLAAALALGILFVGGPRWAALIPTLLYLASVSLLLISGGTNPGVQSTAGGLSALVLLPVLAMALYYPRVYSVITIAAAMVALTAVGIAVQTSEATNLRRLFLWTAVAIVVAFTVHHLRDSLQGKIRDSAELARLGRLMNGATRSLTSLRDPKDVVTEGTQAMAELAGAGYQSACYLRVNDGVVIQEAVVDRVGSVPTSYLLRDDPYLEEIVESGQPALRTLDRTAMGPTMRSVMDERKTKDQAAAAFVPVAVDGQVHGVFRVEGDDGPFSEEVVARCRALGNVIELALGNAIAHQELEIQANTDPLTGLANRRGLALYLDGDRGLGSLSMLVLDIDGLKETNDSHGHDIGDRLLISVARAASGILREGDMLAVSAATSSSPWSSTPTSPMPGGWPIASRWRWNGSRCREPVPR